MKVSKKLTLPIGSEVVTIDFGTLDNMDEIQKSFELRHKVYSRYNYLRDPDSYVHGESDVYDERKECTYFAAVVGERHIGGVRLVQAKTLPISLAFDFEMPACITDSVNQLPAELGRLVVDKYSPDAHTPRNVILLMLTLCLAEHCEAEGIRYALAFLKRRLMQKLNVLGLPYTLITPFELKYSHEGPMAPYFYDPNDHAAPAYVELASVQTFLRSTVLSKNLFEQTDEKSFQLRSTLYSRFLKVIGVI